MEKIQEPIQIFIRKISNEYERKENCLQDRLNCFLEKLSEEYEVKEIIKSNDGIKKEIIYKKPGNQEAKEEQVSGSVEKKSDKPDYLIESLSFDNLVTILSYISEIRENIKPLVNYINNCDSEKLTHTYAEYLNEMDREFAGIQKKYKKSYKEDRDELLDSFVNEFFKILKRNLFEDIVDNIKRFVKSEGEKPEHRVFFKLIDDYLLKCGFEKQEIHAGDKFNRKIAEATREYTDKPGLHKMIKEIIWQPYYLHCYSNYDRKYVDKIFKGKVICYSNKVKGR